MNVLGKVLDKLNHAASPQRHPRLQVAVVGLLGIAVVALLAWAVGTYEMFRASTASQERVALIHREGSALRRVLSGLEDAESNERALVLAREERYFQSFEADRAVLDRTLGELSTVTRANPAQQDAIRQIRSLALAKVAQLQEIITMYRRSGQEAALQIMNTERGQELTNQIALQVGKLLRAQPRLLRKETALAEAVVRRTRWVILLGAVGLLVVLSALATALYQWFHAQSGHAAEQKQTQAALERSKDELERLVGQRTARLQEMVAELEHFSYTITHDMRAPLRAMRGLADLLVDECGTSLQGQRLEYLRRIAESAERMDQLITDALQYNLLVRGRFELEPVDADALLQGILRSYPHLQPPHAHVSVGNRLPVVLANRAGLTQCFSNLLGNAVKFVEPGRTPEVLVRAEETVTVIARPGTLSHPGRTGAASPSLSSWHIPEHVAVAAGPHGGRAARGVRIWFEDKGIGIEKQYHDKIWVMFQRLNKSYAGTGIGLALVRKAVERMGGRVGVESEPGQGSRFWVELLRPGSHLRTEQSEQIAHAA